MTHGCTLREDNAPCVCAGFQPGELGLPPCAYRYQKVDLSPAQSLALNEAYSRARAERTLALA